MMNRRGFNLRLLATIPAIALPVRQLPSQLRVNLQRINARLTRLAQFV
jgi:hypothetical protein